MIAPGHGSACGVRPFSFGWIEYMIDKGIGKRKDVHESTILYTNTRNSHPAEKYGLSPSRIDRVLFAADYPYAGMKEAVEDAERTPISDSDKERIYHLNLECLLRL